jgi:hypothetical protein
MAAHAHYGLPCCRDASVQKAIAALSESGSCSFLGSEVRHDVAADLTTGKLRYGLLRRSSQKAAKTILLPEQEMLWFAELALVPAQPAGRIGRQLRKKEITFKPRLLSAAKIITLAQSHNSLHGMRYRDKLKVNTW